MILGRYIFWIYACLKISTFSWQFRWCSSYILLYNTSSWNLTLTTILLCSQILWVSNLGRAQKWWCVSAPQCLGLELGRLKWLGKSQMAVLGPFGAASFTELVLDWVQLRLQTAVPTCHLSMRLGFFVALANPRKVLKNHVLKPPQLI